jgi:hypothetical protein
VLKLWIEVLANFSFPHSYGHLEICQLLIRHGASVSVLKCFRHLKRIWKLEVGVLSVSFPHLFKVNTPDLWRYYPIHEAAAKGKYEIVKLLLKHGADPSKKNREGQTPLDLVREGQSFEDLFFLFVFKLLVVGTGSRKLSQNCDQTSLGKRVIHRLQM